LNLGERNNKNWGKFSTQNTYYYCSKLSNQALNAFKRRKKIKKLSFSIKKTIFIEKNIPHYKYYATYYRIGIYN
jgi:hypothetical protein